MTRPEVDEKAVARAIDSYALPPCVHIPVAARNEEAIRRFIGEIVSYVIPQSPHNALIVHTYDPPQLDPRLPIWELPESTILHSRRQLCVKGGAKPYLWGGAKVGHPAAGRRVGM